jgi:sec-independent protein translocase protein TatB
MFDIAWSELLLIAIVALVVIGPKDLPQALRVVGQWMAKARLVAQEFQSHLDDMVREADVETMKKEFRDMTRVPEFEKLEGELMRGDVASQASSRTADIAPPPPAAETSADGRTPPPAPAQT